MSFRDRMRKKKGGLKKRHNTPPKSGGGRYPTVFIKKKIPEGIGFFKCSEGQHIIDILPWEVGPDMPLDEEGVVITEQGEFDYVLDLSIHQDVGKMNKPYVCPYENFGLPCPICEYMKDNRLEKDEWTKTRAKRRTVYLIWDRTNAEEEKKGVQLFDVAFFFMEEKIAEIAELPRGGGYVFFSHPDEGKSICWTRKGNGPKNTSYIGHRFVERESAIPDKILDKTFSIDQIINMHPTYEEINEAFDVNKVHENTDDAGPPFDEQEDIPDGGSQSQETKTAAETQPDPPTKRRKRKRR